ncbi:hypothetical protein DDB_G0281065 [Dictyostelium discoideum AX4]|uniref:Uncharacterized protein n=1 Tax=Dictyostelium discoideum TaxID=44689 RepID=Q54UI1_DICDI|nr:hypothetical protein DDB_G0281065 [Dictyostelium discoideum AX4]EAL66829.1 hypothetical protein DDB_G0281065 [Dictyostelium discoideum AX4]|eukprot:XP_640795.1 hypothetical protein DDB_G0281065 [Dictyostelium discoideum AX4]
MDSVENTTTTTTASTANESSPLLNHSSSTMDLGSENVSELLRNKLAQSPTCLFCSQKLNGPFLYSHYISCTNIFLKELQTSFHPSSILSYCITPELLENTFQTPIYIPQLQALIGQLNTHLGNLQAQQQQQLSGIPAPSQATSAATAKTDAKKKK